MKKSCTNSGSPADFELCGNEKNGGSVQAQSQAQSKSQSEPGSKPGSISHSESQSEPPSKAQSEPGSISHSKSRMTRLLPLIAALLLLVFAGLSGCGGTGGGGGDEDGGKGQGTPNESGEAFAPIKIAGLNGPTGMGLAPLMEDERFDISIFQSPDEVVGKVLSGEVDMAAVPSNMGSVLYNKTKGEVRLAAVNTGGVLYLVENGTAVKDIMDLKGKTIYASGRGGAPEFILQRVLLDAGLSMEDVDLQWLANHSDAASSLAVNEGAVALLPQPFVTVVTSKNPSLRVVSDLNEEWKQAYGFDLPMGILLVSRDMAESREADVKTFLQEYEKAIKFVNDEPAQAAEKIAAAGIIENAAVAEKAIPSCNIIFLSGKDAEAALSKFYEVLFEMEPKSLGGKLPDETFYSIGK